LGRSRALAGHAQPLRAPAHALRVVVAQGLLVAVDARGSASSAEGHDPIERARPVEILQRAPARAGQHAIDEAAGGGLDDDLDADPRLLVTEAEGHDPGQRVAVDGESGESLSGDLGHP
jgi:hypothetical protein